MVNSLIGYNTLTTQPTKITKMIITKQAQLDLLAKYQKENNIDKCEGFVDGLNAIIGFINAKAKTTTH